MSLKVFDVPEGTEYLVAKDSRSRWIKSVRVSNLNDALTVAKNATVEKRVIELPADVIDNLKMIKEDNGDDNLQGFMNDVNDDGELWQDVEEFNHSGMPTDALLGEWWLQHVEFVPKKEPKYKVFITNYSVNGYQFISMDVNESEILFVNEAAAISYSESEANKIIEAFGGENGFLQPRKVKVEE